MCIVLKKLLVNMMIFILPFSTLIKVPKIEKNPRKKA
jgi:hypothetical protein